jgi:hypothetical protein
VISKNGSEINRKESQGNEGKEGIKKKKVMSKS